jgi:uncharacterized protein YoxC
MDANKVLDALHELRARMDDIEGSLTKLREDIKLLTHNQDEIAKNQNELSMNQSDMEEDTDALKINVRDLIQIIRQLATIV